MKNLRDPRLFWIAIALLFTLLIIHKVYTTPPVYTLQDSIEMFHSHIPDSMAIDTGQQEMPVIRPK